jgi:hypothetical protein
VAIEAAPRHSHRRPARANPRRAGAAVAINLGERTTLLRRHSFRAAESPPPATLAPHVSSKHVRALHQHRRLGRDPRALRVPIRTQGGTRRFNIAPTQDVLAIVTPEGKPEARLLRWGLIPPWAKDLKGSYKMINAQVETVATKPSYRALIPKASGRALQIADGWFEWLKPEKRGEPRQRSSSGSTAALCSRSPHCGRLRTSARSGSRASPCSRATRRPTASRPRSTIGCP